MGPKERSAGWTWGWRIMDLPLAAGDIVLKPRILLMLWMLAFLQMDQH